ncbi:NADH-quinone oxidoreductase subunit M [Candidatus Parvarchaeota archaeon]|nr:NADH-quinone oxidoreductase subunit M [Candidatus Parvarchaeota archaeon]
MSISLFLFLVIPAIGIIWLYINSLIKPRLDERKIVLSAVAATVATFLVGLITGFSGFSISLVSSIDFSFSLGLNSISIPFMLLAVIVPAIGLNSAFKEIKQNATLFYVLFLLIYMSLILLFVSTNLISLFVVWEVTLISVFFMIAFWGEEETRHKASIKFLVFTQFGSFTLLAGFILMFLYTGSFNLFVIRTMIGSVPAWVSYTIFGLVLMTALIKMPIFPLHSWLPDAHTSAPTTGSVILAGLLLKMGGYVLLLFGLELLPNVASIIQVPALILGVFTLLYVSLVASAQKDFKRLVAYSSIFYMALVFIGIFSINGYGESGAVFLMVSHGFIVSMLFVLAGILKEKTGTRDIDKLGGLAKNMPFYAFFLMFAMLATIGVPGMSNFIGEALVFIGGYMTYAFVLFSLAGVLIATNYYISAIKRILFTSLKKELQKVRDISVYDILQLSFFSMFILVLGIVPGILLNSFSVTL